MPAACMLFAFVLLFVAMSTIPGYLREKRNESANAARCRIGANAAAQYNLDHNDLPNQEEAAPMDDYGNGMDFDMDNDDHHHQMGQDDHMDDEVVPLQYPIHEGPIPSVIQRYEADHPTQHSEAILSGTLNPNIHSQAYIYWGFKLLSGTFGPRSDYEPFLRNRIRDIRAAQNMDQSTEDGERRMYRLCEDYNICDRGADGILDLIKYYRYHSYPSLSLFLYSLSLLMIYLLYLDMRCL